MPTRRSSKGEPGNGGKSSGPGLTRSLLLVAAAVALIAAAVVVIRLSTGEPSGGSRPESLSHIHGLAVNPADGLLYIGSHDGLFALDEDGTVSRVGESRQDLMGLAVAGPDHFLASGHPAPGQDAPSNLGLIESTDGGRTWTSAAFSGEADFHVLRYAHDLVYGVDSASGQLLVGSPPGDWEVRSAEPLFDVAVDPTDPDTLLATGPEGPLRSFDGGRTWEPLEAEPLVLFAWTNSGLLWGIGPNGETYRNYDRGETWGPVFSSAEATPVAATASGAEVYLATADGRILVSGDYTQTWSEVYRASH
jgi:photosystem II stability/assembly factor-like uncharacterized protein